MVVAGIDYDREMALVADYKNPATGEHEIVAIGRLFSECESFYTPKADRWQQGGTGLGLALIQKLVARLDATIQVESRSGQTCFTVAILSKVSGLSARSV